MTRENITEQIPSDLTDIDSSNWPNLYIKSLEIKNFGKYDHVLFDFSNNIKGNNIENIICLIGPNGGGKTTVLRAIQLLFSKYGGYDNEHYLALFAKSVRNYQTYGTDLDKQDFLIKANFVSNQNHNYEVSLTRQKRFISFHPDDIFEKMQYFCFNARFDQELDIFQLKRSKWNKFKILFESITGYEIEEDESLFNQSSDIRLNQLLKEYVLSFSVKKENETISHKQCSAGEKKVIKTFSTILNKPVTPSIILIDNAVMHVEIDRHLSVIKAVEDCFSGSQIILTCHSESIRRNLPDKHRIIDLRYLDYKDYVLSENWRIRYFDDFNDIKEKLLSTATKNNYPTYGKNDLINKIDVIMSNLIGSKDITLEMTSELFKGISKASVDIIDDDLKSCSLIRIKPIS